MGVFDKFKTMKLIIGIKANIRIITGSANLTEKAFKNSSQFEELIAYNRDYNPKFVENFLHNFEEIWFQTVDYVPE